jgi:hypothetical protein
MYDSVLEGLRYLGRAADATTIIIIIIFIHNSMAIYWMKRRNSSATTRVVTPRDDKKMTNVAEGWGGGATDNVGRPNKSLLQDARETAVSESQYVDTICVSYTQTEIFALKKIPGDSKSVQMFNLHLQVYKFGWDTKEQKCKLVDVDPNKSPSTFLSTYVDLHVDDLGHSNLKTK